MKKQKRSLAEVTSNPLFPSFGLCVDPSAEVRLYAVADVLQRIPENAYRSLSEKIDEFVWFIPPDSFGDAMVMPFPCTMPSTKDHVAMAKVLCLLPTLESRGFLISIAAVAHELAHIFLNHNCLFNSPATYAKGEREAWRTVKAWGFEKEERAHAKFWKKYHAEEAREKAGC